MKSEESIPVAVAVGCGLVAAFLTTQARPAEPEVEQVEVPVAAKDLPINQSHQGRPRQSA